MHHAIHATKQQYRRALVGAFHDPNPKMIWR
jgi:hypothetical protein